MTICAIDPGMDGGLALLGPDGLLLEVMPVLPGPKKGRVLDEQALLALLRAWRADHTLLEEQHGFPGRGAGGEFAFATGYGQIRGMLAALGLAHELVPPQRWQRAILGPLAKGESKAAAMSRAAQLWPGQDFRAPDCGPRARLPHSGLCDAALLAEYGRRQLAGGGR